MPAYPGAPGFIPYRNALIIRSIIVVTLLAGFLLLTATVNAQYVARITQIDKQAFPLIRVYVSITDAEGNPISDAQPVELSLYEEGKKVSDKILSTGWTVSSVLVLDISGSMKDVEKLDRAKEAVSRYIEMAGSDHQVAVVVFSDYAYSISKFGDDKNVTVRKLAPLSASGRTALQDGIGVALDMLKGRSGRKVIVALTDGIENNSKRFPSGEIGLAKLLNVAKSIDISIYVVGLGKDVDASYLKRYEETKGVYFFSPNSDQLKSVFERTATLLSKENVLEYQTESQDRDGMSRKISVELKVKDESTSQEGTYTKSGVIPHVRGNHVPYLLLIILLLVVPRGLAVGSRAVSITGFRLANVLRLTEQSEPVKRKMRDRNCSDEDEYQFKSGDLVVKCPDSDCPRFYYVRSWRFSECHCVCGGHGHYCYARVAPSWVRRTLDVLSSRHQNEDTGRTFLCRCAGDKEGY